MKKIKEKRQIISPNDKSRWIVENLTPQSWDHIEGIRMKLHTAICHGLESEEIHELYDLLKNVIVPTVKTENYEDFTKKHYPK